MISLALTRLSLLLKSIFLAPQKSNYFIGFFILAMAVLFYFWGIWPLGIILLPLVFFVKKPELSPYFLFIFIPFKAVLRAGFPGLDILQFVIPLVLVFSIVGFLIKKKIEFNSFDKLLSLLTAAFLISWLGAILWYGFRTPQLLDFFIFLQLVGFYILGKFLLNEKNIARYIILNMIIVNLVALLSIVGYYFGKATPNFIENYELITSRAMGPLLNPNALSGYIAISTSIFITIKGVKNRWHYLLCLLPLIAFVLTFSRGALISLILVAIIFLFSQRKYKSLIIMTAILGIVFLLSPSAYQKRIENIVNPEHIRYSSSSGRIWAINNVFYINRHHLLFGNGPGSYGGEYAYRYASPTYLEGVHDGAIGVANTDNQWLQIYAQQGVVGVWLYALLFATIIFPNWRNKKVYPIILYLVLGIFVDIFQFYQISFMAWLYLGYLSGNRRDIKL